MEKFYVVVFMKNERRLTVGPYVEIFRTEKEATDFCEELKANYWTYRKECKIITKED